jgi:lipid II:glycine glycyltransferase (peptidoglycan interpeptide bridge formation enzyme)
MGWICHLSGWKRVLERVFSHMQGYYFVLLDDSGNHIQAGLPMFHLRSWIIGDRMVSIPFATLCDPLISTASQFSLLFSSIKDLSISMKARHVEIRAHMAGALIRDQGLGESAAHLNHFLELDEPPERLKKKFKRLCVRNINKSNKEGFRVKQAEDESDLKIFYRLHMIHRSKIGLPVHPYKFFQFLWQAFSPGRMRVMLAQKDERTIGALLFFCYGGRISCDYLAIDPHFSRFSPGSFLYWEAIKLGCREGFRIFDFGRTHCQHRSLLEFKSRWGTRQADLPQFFYPRRYALAQAYSGDSNKRRLVNAVCRFAPAFGQRIIGEFLYRHLG